MKPRLRMLLALAAALFAFVQVGRRISDSETELSSRIGPTLPTATALAPIKAGQPLSAARIGFPRVPIRWRQPGAAESPVELAGMSASSNLPAGTMLGPGSAAREADVVSSRLRPGERITSVTAEGPLAQLRAGTVVDVLVSLPGRQVTVAARGAVVVTARRQPAADGTATLAADLRGPASLAVRLADAESRQGVIRLVPSPDRIRQ